MAMRVDRPPKLKSGANGSGFRLGSGLSANADVKTDEGMGRAAISAGLTRGGTHNAAQCRSALHPPADGGRGHRPTYESDRAPKNRAPT